MAKVMEVLKFKSLIKLVVKERDKMEAQDFCSVDTIVVLINFLMV